MTSQPLLYISGPMTGLPGRNYAAFGEAAQQLRAAGYAVISPADDTEPRPDATWHDWMSLSLRQVEQAAGIALLPGWTESLGAQEEVAKARSLALPVATAAAWRDNPGLKAALQAPQPDPRPDNCGCGEVDWCCPECELSVTLAGATLQRIVDDIRRHARDWHGEKVA